MYQYLRANAAVAGLALMLIAAAVTLGKCWEQNPTFPLVRSTREHKQMSWQDTALSLYFLQYFIIKTSHKITTSGMATMGIYGSNLQHVHL